MEISVRINDTDYAPGSILRSTGDDHYIVLEPGEDQRMDGVLANLSTGQLIHFSKCPDYENFALVNKQLGQFDTERLAIKFCKQYNIDKNDSNYKIALTAFNAGFRLSLKKALEKSWKKQKKST